MVVLKTAIIQINASRDKDENLAKAENFIKESVTTGASFITLPEVFNYRGNREGTLENAETKEDGKSVKLIQKLAKENQVWILIGSIMLQADPVPFNTSLLVSPEGKITAEYQKIHLFDMKFKGQTIMESSKSQAGNKPAIAKITHEGKEIKIGLSICYDLRFPELYRQYAKEKVEIITAPSSFTNLTGEAHWHTLLKARAIENLAYVIAPNQGEDENGVRTYGHSLAVEPWGEVIAEASQENEEVIYADIDLDHLDKVRKRLPCLDHRKL